MALTVSPQIRIVALVGLLLAVGFGGAMRFMGPGGSAATEPVPAKNPAVVHARAVAAQASQRAKHPVTPATRPAAKPKAAPTPVVTAKRAPAVTAARKAPVVQATRGAQRISAALAAGLPLPVARALAESPTVVAVVYNPQAQVDAIAYAEARAGAGVVGASFVGLNVLSHEEVGKLTEQLGVLPDPAVLVFTRPAKIAARLDGFADKDTVAQAAENAARSS